MCYGFDLSAHHFICLMGLVRRLLYVVICMVFFQIAIPKIQRERQKKTETKKEIVKFSA